MKGEKLKEKKREKRERKERKEGEENGGRKENKGKRR